MSRQGFVRIMPKEWHDNLKSNKCPVCGLPKDNWKRRKDWRCCSTVCTTKYVSTAYKSWSEIRDRALKRDNYTCVKCGIKKESKHLCGDHIVPIALGGEEFDLENVQTLCVDCHKIKTKEDIAEIAKQRRIDRICSVNQKLF